MTVAIVGLTVFSPVFRNILLTEENARLSMDNQRIEQDLSTSRDERRQIEAANQSTREELELRRGELEQLQQTNRSMSEGLVGLRTEQLLLLETARSAVGEVEQFRRDLRQLELASRQTVEELEQRRVELRQLGAAARDQRAAAWGYVCSQIQVSALARLENSVSELGLELMRWRQNIDLDMSNGRYTGDALFRTEPVPAWTRTLSLDARGRFDAFLARFTSTQQTLLARQYIRRSRAVEARFEADEGLAAQLRTMIARFENECHGAQP